MSNEEDKSRYLFSSTSLLLTPHAVPLIEEKSCIDYIKDIDDVDSDLLSHSNMSWGSMEDRYVPFEILSDDDNTSTISTSSTSSSAFSIILDQMPVPTNVEAIQCVNESSWGSHTLDINSWNDDKAPVVKLRHLQEVLFDDLEFCGFFTDRLIGVGSSFLSKSPENGLYVLNKCIMRNMSLSNITMLNYHCYLRYIDLAYNFISNLSPLGGIPYLMYLNVAHNRMMTTLDFTPPWYLTYVNLSFNYISEMCDISSFWSIVSLDLSHNAIEIISGLQNLKYLKYLNLSYNLIECIENLDKLNIQELNLEGNCITSFKSAIPDYGINTLPHLRSIYLGYNKLTTLGFFKNAYSLRIIDLKFNKINDLLELANFKGLIHEIDLRGNGCTKWPNYKGVLLFSLPSIQVIDGANVSTSEKVAAATVFASPLDLTAARTVTKLTLLEQLNTPKIDIHVKPYDEVSPPLIILTGPSAVKKISLALHVAQILPKRIQYCQWYTTKEPEDSEIEHHSYIFVNREEFNDMSRRGEFLAIQESLGNSYGFHYNQIVSLILENKTGITQMDLHATMQMSKRYSNIKPILVLTKCEKVHRNWIQEKFDVYSCVKGSMENLLNGEEIDKNRKKNVPGFANNTLNFIKDILNDVWIINELQLPLHSTFLEQKNTITNIVFDNEVILPKVSNSDTEMEEKKYITFQEEEINHSNIEFLYSMFEPNKEKGLRVILDEASNVIVEDKHIKRKRQQAKLLHRRSTLLQGGNLSMEEISNSASSDEISTEQPIFESRKPEHLKALYTELVIKTRKMYLDYHASKPGFFSLVLLTDDYFKAFNTLINFIYETYTTHPTEKPKFLSEINHFSQIAIPAMVNTIADEIKQSLSTSILQRKTLLRTCEITSWKDLMPSQMIPNLTHLTD